MVRLLDARLWKRRDYREGAYVHRDLSEQTRLPWYVRVRVSLSARQGINHADEEDAGASVRRRRLMLVALALAAGWVIAQSVPGWGFFD
ncbi:MAG: hypothetical protein ACO268_02590 [Opitutales bacterium]|jgi:hypothetical protein